MAQTAASGPLLGVLAHRTAHDHTTIAYGGGLLLLASAFGNGLNYVFGIFLARTLGSDDFGLYALAITLFNILTLGAVFGMDTGAIKFVSHHLVGGQLRKAAVTLVAAASMVFGSGLLVALGLVSLAPSLAVVYGKPEVVSSCRLLAASIPFATVTAVLLSALQAFQTVRYTILVKYLWEPIAKFLLAAILIWFGFHLYGVLLSIVLTLVVSAALLTRIARRLVAQGFHDRPEWDAHEASTLLAYCLPLSVSNVFGVIAPRADLLILGYWVNTQDVGIYLAAFQTAAIMALVLSAFDTGLAPILSRAWSLHDRIRMGESYQAVARLSITVSFPIFCCLILFSSEVLSMFGPEFAKGSTALVFLACGQIFNNATGSANTVLLMSGHSRIVMMNTMLMGAVLLGTTATAIPLWGMNGAAVAASTTFILTNMMRVVQVWRLHQVQPYTWDLAKPVAAAAFASTIVLLLKQSSFWIPGTMLVAILGMIYVVALWLMGISRQDRILLEALASRGKSLLERRPEA